MTTADANDEEAALWRALREAASSAAREQLFTRYAAFARQIAARHFRDRTSGDLDLHELRQSAYAGLLEAIDRFDPDLGVPFRGFASRRIAGSIVDGISHASELREQFAFRNRIRGERLRSLKSAGTDKTDSDEAMRALAEIAIGLALGFMLEQGLAATDETADRKPSAYEGLAWREAVRRLVGAVERLPPAEGLVIRQHYLEAVSFELIGEILGLSKGRISQLHRSGLSRLRDQLVAAPEFALER